MKDFSIVVATDADQGIGLDGKLPWNLPQDMKFFKNITTTTKDPNKKNAVVMGRKTWESIPERFRPLPQRVNVVLTRNANFDLPTNVLRSQSLEDALKQLEQPPLLDTIEQVFVIGGAQIYTESIQKPQCKTLYVTQILNSFDCDTRFPPYHIDFERTEMSNPHQDGEVTFYFSRYDRILSK